MEGNSIPIFPPWCVVPPIEKHCSLLGLKIPCVPAIDLSSIFGAEIQMGHWITFLLLLCIGVVNLSYVRWPFTYADSMKITTGLYSIATGFFSFVRLSFHISRLLLIAAAIHNLAEWAFLVQISVANTTKERVKNSLRNATYFIIVIIFLVVMMPNLKSAVLVEQTFGIMLDFALPMIYWYMVLTGSKEVQSFYKIPACAHTIHLFFTILPLVFANFHVGYASWYSSFYLETAIYISAPVTHMMYMQWSFMVDHQKMQVTEKDKPLHVIPINLRVKRIPLFLIAGFALGLLPLVAIPLVVLGPCPSTPNCEPRTTVIGTCVAVVHPGFDLAFQDMVSSRKLIEKARAAKGNLGYELVKDHNDPNTFRFIEHWESREDLQAWIAHIAPLFQEPAMKNILVGEKLQQFGEYRYYQPSECRQKNLGAIGISVDASCSKVWSIVSNWSDCSWVYGCNYTVPSKSEPNVRTLHFKDGSSLQEELRKLDHDNGELIYEVTKSAYIGNLKIGDTGSTPGCHTSYRFSVPKGGKITAEQVYDDFLNVRVPWLKKLFKSS